MTFEHGRPAADPDAPNRPELVLIRHGETEWSLTGQHTGRTDLPLTDHGRAEALAISDAVAGYDFDRVYASPLQRAWQTAHLVGLRPERDDDLMEWDYGEIEGRTTAEYREHTPGWSVWTHPIPGGESLADVGARADRVIDRLCSTSGRIGLVAHGHFLRVLGARWAGFDPIEGRRLVLNTSTVSLLGWEREQRVIRRWNDPCGW